MPPLKFRACHHEYARIENHRPLLPEYSPGFGASARATARQGHHHVPGAMAHFTVGLEKLRHLHPPHLLLTDLSVRHIQPGQGPVSYFHLTLDEGVSFPPQAARNRAPATAINVSFLMIVIPFPHKMGLRTIITATE